MKSQLNQFDRQMSRFFDINNVLRTNASFVESIQPHFSRIKKLEQTIGDIVNTSSEVADELRSIYKKSNFNPGLLLPWFFPNAFEGKPLSLRTRPFAMAMTAMTVGGSLTIRGSRQIAKSTTIAARMIVNAWLLKGWRSLYIAPHAEHHRTFVRKLSEMARMCRYQVTDPALKQNMSYREYETGSLIEAAYVSSSASGIRGKTAPELIMDEFQQFDLGFLPEVEQVQKVPKIKSTIYAGTSLGTETALETKYQQGSMGRWMLKLRSGKWCDCSDPEQVLKLFRPQGLTCPDTGMLLDPSNGVFEHAHKHLLDAGIVSLHIPQIIVPDLVADPEQWRSIYKSFFDYNASGQLKKFLQEVLGIPTEEGLKELTEDDMKHICNPDWTPAVLFEKYKKGHYRYVIAGIDWGGSDYNMADKTKQSFTFHMIIGVTQQGTIDILHMRKHAGKDYGRVIADITKDNKKYGVKFVASDHSAGSHYNIMLRKAGEFPWQQHVVMQYGGTTKRFFQKADSDLQNHYQLHKTDAVSTVVEAIKNDKPRIRCYRWELAKNDLMDFTHLNRSIVPTSSGGEKYFYRRHGTKPDDGLHACTFAYTLARLILGEQPLDDPSVARSLYDTLGVRMNRTPGGLFVPSGNLIIPG